MAHRRRIPVRRRLRTIYRGFRVRDRFQVLAATIFWGQPLLREPGAEMSIRAFRRLFRQHSGTMFDSEDADFTGSNRSSTG
ncbi:MAG: hypothetical protein U0992_18605 [Planctomycetaceae bacterium]